MEIGLENTVLKYFPGLTPEQFGQFEKLNDLYIDWNQKVNVISRKDMEAFYLHHVLHSLSIAKFMNFTNGTTFLDLGTGGGFPGIPLAIYFPQCHFHLIDGTAKKIKVVSDVIDKLKLSNCKADHKRSEELKTQYEFITARAVTQLDKLVPLCQKLISKQHKNYRPNGLIALKGGNVNREIRALGKGYDTEVVPVNSFFPHNYFDEKYIIYIQI